MSHACVPLSPERLQNLRWSFPNSYEFARAQATVPLIATELLRVSREYPVLLERQGDRWIPVAYLSDAAGTSNRFVAADGRWKGSYVPFWLRVRPFVPEADGLGLLLDPALVGVAGAYAFTQDGPTLSMQARSVESQIRKALGGRSELATAATALVENGVALVRPGAGREGQADLASVPPHHPAEIMGAKIGEWYARSPKAIELAIAAAFSASFLPRAEPSEVTLPSARPPPETLPPASSPLYVPPAAPADLDWLDTNEKVMF